MDDHQLKQALESLLFVSGGPLTVERFKGIFEETTREQIETQLQGLRQEYEDRASGIMLAEVAGGYQFATRPECAPWIRRFKSVKVSTKLSKPALETLAIVAYKQPITRMEVEAVRGVNIGGIMRNLMERRLVKIVGKKDIPGKPMMYGTTLEFLQYFGLKDLSALPTLKEFQELEAGEEVMEEFPAATGNEENISDEELEKIAAAQSEEVNENAVEKEPENQLAALQDSPQEIAAETEIPEDAAEDTPENIPSGTETEASDSEQSAAPQPHEELPAGSPAEENFTG